MASPTVGIAMGKVENPHLAQRVDAFLVKALDVFLKDPEIITRYNRAFEMDIVLSLKTREPSPILDSLLQTAQTPALATFLFSTLRFSPLLTKLQISPLHNTLKGLVLVVVVLQSLHSFSLDI